MKKAHDAVPAWAAQCTSSDLRIRAGGRVIVADISKERLDDLVAKNAVLDLVPVAGDISTEETVSAVVAAAGGRVDALANVAGIMDNFAPIHEVDDDLWDRVFRINVTALMRLTRAVVPLMLMPAPAPWSTSPPRPAPGKASGSRESA